MRKERRKGPSDLTDSLMISMVSKDPIDLTIKAIGKRKTELQLSGDLWEPTSPVRLGSP